MPPPPTAEPKKRKTGRIVLIVTLLTFLCIAGCVAAGVGYILATGAFAGDNVPTDAWVGECYGRDGTKEPVPCSEPHYFEVFEVAIYDDATGYPNRFERNLGIDVCDDTLSELLNQNLILADYDYTAIYPTAEEWENGERFVPCAAFHIDLDPITGYLGD